MTGLFEERERGYEAKWAHDEESLFEIMTMRNARLGQWAAEAMQLPAAEAQHYAQAVVHAGLTGKDKDPVFEKIRGDFSARMVACPNSVIQRKMKDLFDQAAAAISKKT